MDDWTRCARCRRPAPAEPFVDDPETVGWYVVVKGVYGSDVDGIVCAACATDEVLQAAVGRARQTRGNGLGD